MTNIISDKVGIINPKKKKKLALVLGGGAAMAIAHIGVLQVLEENKIPIDAIIGTSMGAAIGGIYASGNLKKFTKDLLILSKSKLKSFLFSTRFMRININSIKLFSSLIKRYADNIKIEDLSISFTAIAVDLKTGDEVFLNKGSLDKAILASISIPGIFKPIKYNNMLLVDGGVIDPLPFEYGMKIAKKVIAVNVSSIRVPENKNSHMLNVITNSIEIMTNRMIKLARDLSLHNPENKKMLFIQIDTDQRKLFDIYNISKLIEIGRKATEKEIKNINKLLKN